MWVIFVIFLFLYSYAMFHSTRHAFSNVKSSTERVWTPTEHNESDPEVGPYEVSNALLV